MTDTEYIIKPQDPKPSQSKYTKAYHNRYWHNVRKPKLVLELEFAQWHNQTFPGHYQPKAD